MSYISKKIEKKIFINFFFFINKKKIYLFYDVFSFYFKMHNIFFSKDYIYILKKYLKEIGFLNY